MNTCHIHVIAPIAGLLINVLFQIGCFRLFPAIGLLRSLSLGFGSGFAGMLLIEIYADASFLTSAYVSGLTVLNAITYSALGYCYFHFVNLGETARWIRILRELYESGGCLSIEDILKKYNATDILQRRLNRHINNGQIIERDGKYYIGSPVMLTIARVIVAMKLILLGKKSEFDWNRGCVQRGKIHDSH